MRFLSASSFADCGIVLKISLVAALQGLRDGLVRHSQQSNGSEIIDLACLRESYHNHKTNIYWYPTRDMPVIPCTKNGNDCNRLMNVLNIGHLAASIADASQRSLKLPCRDLGLW
jgi:hypothetical protein